MGELTKTEDDDVDCDDDVCAIPNQFPSSSIWHKNTSCAGCFWLVLGGEKLTNGMTGKYVEWHQRPSGPRLLS